MTDDATAALLRAVFKDPDVTITPEDRCVDCGSVFPAHRCTFEWVRP